MTDYPKVTAGIIFCIVPPVVNDLALGTTYVANSYVS